MARLLLIEDDRETADEIRAELGERGIDTLTGPQTAARCRRWGGRNKGGVVSGVFNLESSGVSASDWRPRHDKHYHEA